MSFPFSSSQSKSEEKIGKIRSSLRNHNNHQVQNMESSIAFAMASRKNIVLRMWQVTVWSKTPRHKMILTMDVHVYTIVSIGSLQLSVT